MNYDPLKTLAKGAIAALLAFLVTFALMVADWLVGAGAVDAAKSALSGAPDYVVAAAVAALHALGVALANWIKHRGKGGAGQ